MCTAGTVPGGLYISQVFAACLYADLTQQLGNPHTGSDERRDHNGKRMSRTLYALAMGMFGGQCIPRYNRGHFTPAEIPEAGAGGGEDYWMRRILERIERAADMSFSERYIENVDICRCT